MERELVMELWEHLDYFDEPYESRPSRYNSLTVRRMVSEDVQDWLRKINDWDIYVDFIDGDFFLKRDHEEKMDIIEYWYSCLSQSEQSDFQHDLNELCFKYSFPWVMANGYFFRIELKFIDMEIIKPTLEMMAHEKFTGSLDELVEALGELTAGNYKDAIHKSAKSFESVMKAVLGVSSGTASNLLRGLEENDFFDDITPTVSKAIGDSVFMGLPFMRNRLGGHGQGQDILKVPENYARLAVELAVIFNRFIIQQSGLLTKQNDTKEVNLDEIVF